MIFPSKIISGGQTGADQGGLLFALKHNIETGGHMPKGFRTENGFEPYLGDKYNMQEINTYDYKIRTAINVKNSTGTLIFGNINSSGSQLTRKLCEQYDKPFHIIKWPSQNYNNTIEVYSFLEWINENTISILNVAGNRESINEGINDAVCSFLDQALIEFNYRCENNG